MTNQLLVLSVLLFYMHVVFVKKTHKLVFAHTGPVYFAMRRRLFQRYQVKDNFTSTTDITLTNSH